MSHERFWNHPLIAALSSRHGAAALGPDTAGAFCAGPGVRLVVFLEEPERHRETLDLAVIVGELARTFAGQFAIGVPDPDTARVLQPSYPFRRWPALVLVRDGACLGAIDGLRPWDEYMTSLAELLAGKFAPLAIGIPVVVQPTAPAASNARSTS